MTHHRRVLREAQKLKIVDLRARNETFKSISAKTGIPLTTVKNVYHRYRYGHRISVRHRSGRPHILTKENKSHLVEKVLNKDLHTTLQCVRYCLDVFNKHVSHQTISRVLGAAGLRPYKTTGKPVLDDDDKRKRLEFALKYQHWTAADWKKVIFSDETTIRLYPLNHNERVWALPSDYLNEDLVVPRVHSEGGGIMIWSCITTFGLHDVVSVEGTLNSVKYGQILHEYLFPLMDKYFPDGDLVFMQDNAPVHRATNITELLNSKDITTFDWPPYSPDLNPIENFWAYFKKQILKEEQADNVEELWNNTLKVSKDLWKKETTIMINKSFDSMPQRLQEVIVAQGGHTTH